MTTKVEKKTTSTTKSSNDSDAKKSMRGFLMWGIILAGYLLFCFNWMVMDNMKGAVDLATGPGGWVGSFFAQNPAAGSIVDQAPNWTLTAMRGVGALLAGWVLVKIGHKYSVTIAISLLAFGGILGPLVALGGNQLNVVGETTTDHTGLFILFLLFRMAMAVGATTLIVYTQPVIADYFNERQRGLTNLVNSFSFNTGSMIAIAVLTFGLKDVLVQNWIVFTSCVSIIAIVLLVLWLVFAENIATPDDTSDTATYGGVLKEKRTILFSIMFAMWLTWVVLYLTMVPGSFIQKINDKANFASWYLGTWKILFLGGLFAGIPLFQWLNNKGTARKPVIMITLTIGILLTIITSLIGAYLIDVNDTSTTQTLILVMFFLTSFFAGMAGWGIQGYILGTTNHYEGATPKKQGILIGACWGLGYIGETIATIVSSEINTALNKVDAISASTVAWVFMAIYLLYCVTTVIMWIFIPETHGKNASEDSIHFAGKKSTAKKAAA